MPVHIKRFGSSWQLEASSLGQPLIKECGWVENRRAFPLRPHRNPGYELTVALTGDFIWEIIDGPSLHLHGGQVCLMQPRVLHRGRREAIAPGRLLYLVIDPSAKLADLGTPFDAEDLRNLETLLQNMGNRVRDTSEAFLAAVQNLVDLPARINADWIGPALTAAIIRVLIEFIHLSHAKTHSNKDQDQTIVAAQVFMKQHLEKRLDMGAIATRFGLGRSTFFARFHRATGQSPLDWILRQRCQEACRLLESPQPSITAIALRCGFGSSQYFSRVMRRITGLSPSQYRQGRVVPPKEGK